MDDGFKKEIASNKREKHGSFWIKYKSLPLCYKLEWRNEITVIKSLNWEVKSVHSGWSIHIEVDSCEEVACE